MGRGGKSSDAIRDDTVWREDGGKSFLVPVFYPPSERRLTKVFIFILIKMSILYSIYLDQKLFIFIYLEYIDKNMHIINCDGC
jgi:hypothetical protein